MTKSMKNPNKTLANNPNIQQAKREVKIQAKGQNPSKIILNAENKRLVGLGTGMLRTQVLQEYNLANLNKGTSRV